MALMETLSSCGMGADVTMPKRNNDAMRVLMGGRCMILSRRLNICSVLVLGVGKDAEGWDILEILVFL